MHQQHEEISGTSPSHFPRPLPFDCPHRVRLFIGREGKRRSWDWFVALSQGFITFKSVEIRPEYWLGKLWNELSLTANHHNLNILLLHLVSILGRDTLWRTRPIKLKYFSIPCSYSGEMEERERERHGDRQPKLTAEDSRGCCGWLNDWHSLMGDFLGFSFVSYFVLGRDQKPFASIACHLTLYYRYPAQNLLFAHLPISVWLHYSH